LFDVEGSSSSEPVGNIPLFMAARVGRQTAEGRDATGS